jgi:hypothetical protein
MNRYAQSFLLLYFSLQSVRHQSSVTLLSDVIRLRLCRLLNSYDCYYDEKLAHTTPWQSKIGLEPILGGTLTRSISHKVTGLIFGGIGISAAILTTIYSHVFVAADGTVNLKGYFIAIAIGLAICATLGAVFVTRV